MWTCGENAQKPHTDPSLGSQELLGALLCLGGNIETNKASKQEINI